MLFRLLGLLLSLQISTVVFANSKTPSKATSRGHHIWQAPSLSPELPETTRAGLEDRGLAFIPKRDLPAGDSDLTHEYAHQDPFMTMLRKEKTWGRLWGKVIAATRQAGLLSKETAKIASGLVHTMPSIGRATDGPGSETSRTLYLGGKVFVKGGGLIAPYRQQVTSYIIPKVDPTQSSHEPFGGAQWQHLKRQFRNHVWMHAVTLELFGELANTAIPLRMSQLTAVRLPDGSMVDQAKILTDKTFWSSEKDFRDARKAMRKHLGDRSKSLSPEQIAEEWIAYQKPAQMIYLFRRGRDILTRINGSRFFPDDRVHANRSERLRSVVKELQTYARNHGAWIALGLDTMRDGRSTRGSRDLSRGFITDLDVAFHTTSVTSPEVPQDLVEKVAGFYLTRKEYEQVKGKLNSIARMAMFSGWQAALNKIVFSDRKTDLISKRFRNRMRRAWRHKEQELTARYAKALKQAEAKLSPLAKAGSWLKRLSTPLSQNGHGRGSTTSRLLRGSTTSRMPRATPHVRRGPPETIRSIRLSPPARH